MKLLFILNKIRLKLSDNVFLVLLGCKLGPDSSTSVFGSASRLVKGVLIKGDVRES